MSETFIPIFYGREAIREGWCNLYSRGPKGEQQSVAGRVYDTRDWALAADVHDIAYARVRIIPKVSA